MAQAASFNDYVRLVRGMNSFWRLLHIDCINGFAVGRKYSKGKVVHNSVALVFYVNKKLSLNRLPIENRIPERLILPSERGESLEFLTDVQEARFTALAYTGRERPAPSGISVGHVNITAGTLGGLVKDSTTGNLVILSNNHVLADSNDAAIGDPILQPGPADGGAFPADHIANLTRFVPITFGSGGANRVDGAIARPINNNDLTWFTRDIGAERPYKWRTLTLDDLGVAVRKTGRTTEHTTGFIEGLFATTSVKFGMFRKATFVDQITISYLPAEESFSAGGDSGSLIYDFDDFTVGLLFAGSEGSGGEAGMTIANPMNFVINELEIEMLQPGEHPSNY